MRAPRAARARAFATHCMSVFKKATLTPGGTASSSMARVRTGTNRTLGTLAGRTLSCAHHLLECVLCLMASGRSARVEDSPLRLYVKKLAKPVALEMAATMTKVRGCAGMAMAVARMGSTATTAVASSGGVGGSLEDPTLRITRVTVGGKAKCVRRSSMPGELKEEAGALAGGGGVPPRGEARGPTR